MKSLRVGAFYLDKSEFVYSSPPTENTEEKGEHKRAARRHANET